MAKKTVNFPQISMQHTVYTLSNGTPPLLTKLLLKFEKGLFHYLLMCLKYAEQVSNSVDPDKMPHSAASDLGLHCLFRSVCPNIYCYFTVIHVQLTLVVSTSLMLISNNRLSPSENLVPVLTWKSNNRYQNIVEKRSNFSSFPQYFQYIS